jgi:hypothetical protein
MKSKYGLAFVVHPVGVYKKVISISACPHRENICASHWDQAERTLIFWVEKKAAITMSMDLS